MSPASESRARLALWAPQVDHENNAVSARHVGVGLDGLASAQSVGVIGTLIVSDVVLAPFEGKRKA